MSLTQRHPQRWELLGTELGTCWHGTKTHTNSDMRTLIHRLLGTTFLPLLSTVLKAIDKQIGQENSIIPLLQLISLLKMPIKLSKQRLGKITECHVPQIRIIEKQFRVQ